ncbi:hypothetical protein JWG45_09935 [Leptospira sp. 201903070]|uniref:Uncharacterized protein n=1 Tax=Leptospira ainlahdjerensis TaxID=2810033 RepID=A0ABS2UAS5_9LEPT|nr:hypothetical protein [Leptospira ainlahdjerensis]MBM9577471.1 hypothetical protein [Leptospira ainlahdjerensis]
MSVELCIGCNRNVSLFQTDLCEECLKENFQDLTRNIDKIRPSCSKFSPPVSKKNPCMRAV